MELKRTGPYLGEVIHMSRRLGWFAGLWNWKSALLSSLFRSLIFFFVNWKAGPRAATGAMLAELLYRSLTAGFYGTITQRLRRIEPPWRGVLAASVLLPTLGHSLEWLVHRLRGTPNLRAGITASVVFTLVSSLFHLFAMRRGHFIVGEGSRPLLHDLRRHERSGFIARDEREFIGYVLRALRCPGMHASMRLEARRQALEASWDRVFETVWQGYRQVASGEALEFTHLPQTACSRGQVQHDHAPDLATCRLREDPTRTCQ